MLGMHRSGTSLLANIVGALGVHLGEDDELMPPSGNNVFGYYELDALKVLNDHILNSFNGSWKRPVKVHPDKVAEEFTNNAKNILKSLKRKSSVIGFKDPRLAMTIDFWSQLSQGNEYIYIFRHPISTAKSIAKAESINIGTAFKLWREYNEAILRFLEGKKFLLIRYEDILSQPETEVARIIEYLSLNPKESEIQRAINSVVPAVDHFGSKENMEGTQVGDREIKLYEKLLGLVEESKKSFKLKTKQKKVTLEKIVENYKNKIKELDKLVYDREVFYKHLNDEVTRLATENKGIVEEINEKKREIENLIFEKKKLNKDIKLRENYLKSIINDLRIQNQQLNSRSWKIFFNLRLRVLRIVKIINRILSFAVFKKFFTLLNVYKSLGFDGLRVLFKYKLNKLEDYPVDKFVIEYLKWQKKKEPKSKIKKVSTDENLKFSIVMPVWNVSPDLLKKAIQSVERQTYNNWELCIYDDASTNLLTKEFLNSIKDSSPRIKIKFGEKNLNISLATNEALKLATGEYVLFLDNDDSLAPHALNEIAHVIKNNPKTDVIYYDEDIMLMNDLRVKPILKPDWSPETLDAMMYLAHSTYRRSLLNKLGGMRAGFEGSQDYDLILRVREKTENIVHIPKILYHWRRIPGSTADVFEEKDYAKTAAVKALKESIKRRKLKADLLSGLTAPSNRFKYKIQNRPLVSIIIPTKNMTNYLRDCITSIENNTKYKNYEIIIVNNQSDDKTTLRYLEKISDKYTVLDYNKEFNYSAINNFAVSHAKGEHVLLLNNDIKIINEDWLGSMLEFSQQKRIGAVGALLFFEDDTIQHAGCAVGIGGVAGHFYKYARMGDYQMNMSLDFPKIIHNVSAVTGACLMVKKKVYLQVGGLDEKFKVAFNDIDFCLKVHTAGYRNIYTPFAQLYHYESKTRGYEHLDPTQQLRFNNEVKYFKTKWKKFLNDGDPYYNANFTLKDELGGLNMK